MVSIQKKLEMFCTQDPEMKHWAQRSFICYLRSIHLQSNKKIFDVHKLPTTEYANSLGLAQPPRIRFLRHAERKQRGRKQASGSLASEASHESSSDEVEQNVEFGSGSEDEEMDVLKVKRVIHPEQLEEEARVLGSKKKVSKSAPKRLTRVGRAKKVLHKKIKVNKHIKFDEEGNPLQEDIQYPDLKENQESDDDLIPAESIKPIPIYELSESNKEQIGGISIEKAQRKLKSRDPIDRKRERQRIKIKHLEKKEKAKRQKFGEEGDAHPVVLASPEPEGQVSGEDEAPSSDVDSSEEDIGIPAAKRVKSSNLATSGQLDLLQDEELALHMYTTVFV